MLSGWVYKKKLSSKKFPAVIVKNQNDIVQINHSVTSMHLDASNLYRCNPSGAGIKIWIILPGSM